MIIGISIPNLSHYLANESLRKASREFKLLSRTAYLESITQLKPTQILFERQAISIVHEKDPSDILKSLQLPNGVDYQFRYWGEDNWQIPLLAGDEMPTHLWTFDPAGLCEPLEIRFLRKESWVELTMDPLTGNPSDESYYYQ